MYYLCSENKGADQLRGYREADLRLCFRICKKPVFSRRGSIMTKPILLHLMEVILYAHLLSLFCSLCSMGGMRLMPNFVQPDFEIYPQTKESSVRHPPTQLCVWCNRESVKCPTCIGRCPLKWLLTPWTTASIMIM